MTSQKGSFNYLFFEQQYNRHGESCITNLFSYRNASKTFFVFFNFFMYNLFSIFTSCDFGVPIKTDILNVLFPLLSREDLFLLEYFLFHFISFIVSYNYSFWLSLLSLLLLLSLLFFIIIISVISISSFLMLLTFMKILSFCYISKYV